jgi:general secretion pathway protein M
MDKVRELINDIRTWFDRLSNRERQLVALTSAAVLGFIIFIILLSFSNTAQRYQRRIDDKLKSLQQVKELASSYRQAAQERQEAEQQLQASNVRLISYIEERATQAGLEVPNMTPKGDVPLGEGQMIESSVELTFTDVNLLKLTEFLRLVEGGPGVVKVKTLRLETRSGTETLTAWTTVATYRMKQ